MTYAERDPHGIVPESFWQRYDSIAAAQRDAERQGTTQPRCPNRRCHSTRIQKKVGADSPQRKPGAYRCDNCGEHFDEPAPSKREASLQFYESQDFDARRAKRAERPSVPDSAEQATLGEVGR
jgi:hypothetical protein